MMEFDADDKLWASTIAVPFMENAVRQNLQMWSPSRAAEWMRAYQYKLDGAAGWYRKLAFAFCDRFAVPVIEIEVRAICMAGEFHVSIMHFIPYDAEDLPRALKSFLNMQCYEGQRITSVVLMPECPK